MPSKALQLRIQQAERDLRVLQEQSRQLEAKLDALKTSVEREESERSTLPTADTVSKAPASPPPLPTPEPVTAPEPAPNPIAVAAKQQAVLPEQIVVTKRIEPAPTTTDDESEGLELKLGRVWFVRIGIGFLLTGFVFLSTYAYQNFIIHWPAGIRVAALYLLAALLTGTGLVLERWKESLQNYGRVVAAGGWAAAYYTTYAAHHVEHLRVIPSAVTAAVLLTLCALAFFSYAAWKRSSILTVAALAMAFYSVAINPIGNLGCFSALLLSAIGVFFLVRFRWMHTGFAALIGAYFSYAWWQGLVHVDGGNDASRWFLLGYWILFTVGVLASRPEKTSATTFATFASLNNVLCFGLFNFDFDKLNGVPDLWRNALVFGGILLALSAAVSRFARYPARLWHVLLPQGLALVTWGLSIKLTGHHLFISLTLEALVLAALWKRTDVQIFRAFAWIAATIGILSAVTLSSPITDAPPISAYLIETALLVGFALLIRGAPFFQDDHDDFSVEATIASVAAFLVPSVGILPHLATDHAGLWMLGSGLVLWIAYLLQARKWPLPELIWLAQPYAAMGGLIALVSVPSVPLLGLTLAMSAALFHLHAWSADNDRGTTLPEASRFMEAAFTALSLLAFVLLIIEAFDSNTVRILIFAAAPLLLHTYGSLSGRRILAAFSQALYLPVIALSIMGSDSSNPDPSILAQAGAIAIILGHLVAVHVWPVLQLRDTLRELLLLLLVVLWTVWNGAHVESWWLILAWSGAALAFVPDTFRAKVHDTCVGGLLVLAFIGTISHDASSFLLRYLAIAAPLLIHLLRSPINREADQSTNVSVWDGLALGTVLALTIVASQHTLHTFDGTGLAICWALLGLGCFGLGITTKRRVYRLCGLVLLALSLGHVLCVDVWKLGTVLRILSFLTVGLVLLALGFVYNRFHEKLRHLL